MTQVHSGQASPGVLLVTWAAQAAADGEIADGKLEESMLRDRGLSNLKPNATDFVSAWQVELPSDAASSSSRTQSPCRGQAEEIQALRQELASEAARRKWEQADW